MYDGASNLMTALVQFRREEAGGEKVKTDAKKNLWCWAV